MLNDLKSGQNQFPLLFSPGTIGGLALRNRIVQTPMGTALMELGRYAEARDAYGESLRVDPMNTIAQKNHARLAKLAVVVRVVSALGARERNCGRGCDEHRGEHQSSRVQPAHGAAG